MNNFMPKNDMDLVSSFNEERKQLNELVLKYGGQLTKRFFSLDTQAYQDGALPAKTKELIGLVASLVLRCDDCIKYHLNQCRQQGVSTAELVEAIETGLVVGGSITIPHIRKAFKYWEALLQK
jgi:AhpD family alkylhydroperoxidase